MSHHHRCVVSSYGVYWSEVRDRKQDTTPLRCGEIRLPRKETLGDGVFNLNLQYIYYERRIYALSRKYPSGLYENNSVSLGTNILFVCIN